MLWIVRGTRQQTLEQVTIKIQAATRAQAESEGFKRGLLVSSVGSTHGWGDRLAAATSMLWPQTSDNVQACATPASIIQFISLLILGAAGLAILFRSLVLTAHL